MSEADLTKPSPELEVAVWSTLYHDPRSTPEIIRILTGKIFETPPPAPTEDQRHMAHNIVGELLQIHYVTLNEACLEVMGEGIEMPEFDDSDIASITGLANCECVYHAEQGIPCCHDIALYNSMR